MQVGVHNGISQDVATAHLRQIANHIEAVSDGKLSVVATSDLAVNNENEGTLLQTVIKGLILTLVSVFLFLMLAYQLVGNSASLSLLTLLSVLFAVTWILGTM